MSTSTRPPQARFLDVLSHVSQIVSYGRSLDAILSATVNLIKTMLDVERCSILILDPIDRVLCLKAASSIDRDEWDKIRIPLGQGISGKVAQDGRPLLVEDVDTSPYQGLSPRGRYSTASFICVPLVVKGRVIGIINVNNRTDTSKFNRDDLDLIIGLAGLIALAIDNARLVSSRETMRLHLEKIVDSLPLGIVTTDLQGRVTLSNRRAFQIIGIRFARPVENTDLRSLLPDPLRAVLGTMVQETIKYGVDLHRELEVPDPLNPDERGAGLPLEISTSALTGSSGETDGVLITFLDLSIRREVDELRRIDEMKSNFLSMVSHELRTPLTSIKGAVHLLLHTKVEKEPDETRSRLLTIVESNTERLARLVNDLLDIVQIEDQALVLNRHKEDLADLINGCLDGYVRSAESKGIHLGRHLGQVHAFVDRHRLAQAIGQLVDNAIKFTPKGGAVDVTLFEPEPGIARIVVQDSGPGIAQDVHHKLFTKFFQAQNPLTRTVGGTGIGLYLSKCIIVLHGGRIHATEGLREGAEFVIELPTDDPNNITVH